MRAKNNDINSETRFEHLDMLTLKTGVGGDEAVEDEIAAAAHRLLCPCLEAAAIVASEYARASGRDVVMARDFEMGLKFAARHVLGRQTESFFPDSDEEAGDEDDSSVTSVDEAECEWTRYEGEDERLLMVNRACDTWDEWAPETPLEEALKRSVDATVC